MTEIWNGLLAGKAMVYAYSGADFPREECVLQDRGGAAWDLTGRLLQFFLKAYDDAGGPPLIHISSAPSLDPEMHGEIEIIDAPNGVFRRLISKAALAALPRLNTPTNELAAFRFEFTVDNEMVAYGEFYLKGDVQ